MHWSTKCNERIRCQAGSGRRRGRGTVHSEILEFVHRYDLYALLTTSSFLRFLVSPSTPALIQGFSGKNRLWVGGINSGIASLAFIDP
ncbi:hypothetical protein EDD80_103277 [Anseongella ginsenosidimutans]|uniref:Uncharacterized protein n=1 Tax=Anseongella ginsenosidimutans TaxID=496056 RepID=A0A4V2UTZ6_9SPHI|nr:hypothetical protein EDD80_103277 [Anseongella ginsenosidimutans]